MYISLIGGDFPTILSEVPLKRPPTRPSKTGLSMESVFIARPK